jgi:uncharacterized SAM-binding protein YcdF (DUF218 family)
VKRKTLRRRAAHLFFWGGIGVFVAAVGIYVFWPRAIFGVVTSVVVVDDPLEPADLVFVLNGSYEARVAKAAELYHLALAPNVRLAHTREMARRPDRPLSDLIASRIVDHGVPQEAVAVVPYSGGVVNTRDEARAFREYVERQPASRVIIVTTDNHTGRARRVFRQELRGTGVDIRMAASPDLRGFTPSNWWRSEAGRRIYGAEFLKQIASIILFWTGAS